MGQQFEFAKKAWDIDSLAIADAIVSRAEAIIEAVNGGEYRYENIEEELYEPFEFYSEKPMKNGKPCYEEDKEENMFVVDCWLKVLTPLGRRYTKLIHAITPG